MTDDEQNALRAELARMQEDWKRWYPDNIINDDVRLNEDSGQFYTTEAEILVFNLPREQLYELHVAYYAYEGLIDIIGEEALPSILFPLLVKARSLCPPFKYGGQEFPFETGISDEQIFQWFAKEFFGISYRVSRAFWHKRAFNLARIAIYADEDERLMALKFEQLCDE